MEHIHCTHGEETDGECNCFQSRIECEQHDAEDLSDPGVDSRCEDAEVVALCDRLEREAMDYEGPACWICDGDHGGRQCPAESRYESNEVCPWWAQ